MRTLLEQARFSPVHHGRRNTAGRHERWPFAEPLIKPKAQRWPFAEPPGQAAGHSSHFFFSSHSPGSGPFLGVRGGTPLFEPGLGRASSGSRGRREMVCSRAADAKEGGFHAKKMR
jgi:hypothetical protein